MGPSTRIFYPCKQQSSVPMSHIEFLSEDAVSHFCEPVGQLPSPHVLNEEAEGPETIMSERPTIASRDCGEIR